MVMWDDFDRMFLQLWWSVQSAGPKPLRQWDTRMMVIATPKDLAEALMKRGGIVADIYRMVAEEGYSHDSMIRMPMPVDEGMRKSIISAKYI